MPADAKNVGDHLDKLESPVRVLLDRARVLGDLQKLLHEWTSEPFTRSLRIVNLRDGVVVVHADSAAVFTQLRYRQQELLQFLKARLGEADLKLEIKMRPKSQNG